MGRLRRPPLFEWRSWSWEDYLAYFLSFDAAKSRAKKREVNIVSVIGERDFHKFCEPIRERLMEKFCGSQPQVSIQMPARNDAMELLATLVSYTLLNINPGLAELIVVDNGSEDGTDFVISSCGVKGGKCQEKGIGKARAAAYMLTSKSVEIVWLTDCDTRTICPLNTRSRTGSLESSVFSTVITHFTQNPRTIGLSTGWRYEYAHPVFWIIRSALVAIGRAPRIHAWSGPNQTFRRCAIDAIGGIHLDFQHRDRDDHQRAYEIARWAKQKGYNLESAATNLALYDPMYHSGRNRGTLKDVFRAVRQGSHRPRLPRDKFGFPIDPRDRIKM